MCSNFAVPMSCLIIATLIIPPASAPTKNPSISKNPCIRYWNIPTYITSRKLTAFVIPVSCAISSSSVFMKYPIAIPITVAFHVSTNIAPAPYMNENIIAISSTVMLLKNMVENLDRLFVCVVSVALLVIPPISANVLYCASNTCVSTPVGRKMYSAADAITTPRNRYMNAFSAFQCSSSSILCGRSCRSFCSSYFIILYISGVAPMATKATTIMLAYSLKNWYPMSDPSSVSAIPIGIIRCGFFSAFVGSRIDSTTI